MNTLTLTIASTTINQDNQGRYCLNDLHKAAGSESKNQPAFFMRRNDTKELIAELSSANSQTIPVETITGKNKEQGTYVVKELVYAYAMWISPKFHLQVIRAYDALITRPPMPAALEQPYEFLMAVTRLKTLAPKEVFWVTVDEWLAAVMADTHKGGRDANKSIIVGVGVQLKDRSHELAELRMVELKHAHLLEKCAWLEEQAKSGGPADYAALQAQFIGTEERIELLLEQLEVFKKYAAALEKTIALLEKGGAA